MPLDGLTLGVLTRELQFLIGGRVDKVSQPEKDMIILTVRADNRNARLLLSAAPAMTRLHLTEESAQNPPDAPMFCMLLRKYLSGGRIQSIEQIASDRLIKIVIDNRDELGETGPREIWFEAMGRCSNLVLTINGRIIDAIRHVNGEMSRVRQLLPGLPYQAPPAQDKLPPCASREAVFERLQKEKGRVQKALLGAVSGLSPLLARELTLRLTGLNDPLLEEISVSALADKLAAFFADMDHIKAPVLLTDENGARADYFPFPYFSYPAERQQKMKSLSEAMERFYSDRDRADRMAQKSASLKKNIKTHLERCEKKLALQEEELMKSARADEHRLAGELLSAQLYLVKKGTKKVSVQNFYDEHNAMIEIALDETLTPAQNAQKYFKKYKKALAARKTAAEQKQNTLAEISLLETALCDLPNCENTQDLSDIRRTLENAGMIKRERAAKGQKRPQESKPYFFTATDGTPILVGKNSLQNERLTKNARGEDLWLHAKDIPGSHVIVCLEGRALSDGTLLEAAQLAAFYSKARGVSVPIDYTLRRYVKKPANTPTGFVTFTNNKTLLIDASEADILRLKTDKD